jgi:hypothetical protein
MVPIGCHHRPEVNGHGSVADGHRRQRSGGRGRDGRRPPRATFVTIALATGKTETWLSDRMGRDGHTMIEKYRRKARTWNLGELGLFTTWSRSWRTLNGRL